MSDRLLHPAFLLALAVLLLNDHVLKDAFASPITSKLSDVAGLVVLPVLLTALLDIRSRQLVWCVHGTVGLAFVALQFISPETLWSLTVLPFRHTPDPTDLLALTILPLGVRLSLLDVRPLKGRSHPARAHVVGLVAVGAVLATSPPRAPFVVEVTPVVAAATPDDALEVLEARLTALGFDVRAPRVLPYADWLANQSSWQDGEAARARHAEVTESVREDRATGRLQYGVTVPPGICDEAPPATSLELDLETHWDMASNELAMTVHEVSYGAGEWQFAGDAVREEGRRLVTVCVVEPLLASTAAN